MIKNVTDFIYNLDVIILHIYNFKPYFTKAFLNFGNTIYNVYSPRKPETKSFRITFNHTTFCTCEHGLK